MPSRINTGTDVSGARFLLLSAGMPRSGSTWLYNAMRLLLRANWPGPDAIEPGWIGDLDAASMHPRRLVKLHEHHPVLVEQATFIAYSFRDLRDAMASAVRKFGRSPDLGHADHLVRQDALWKACAHHVMRYEDMLADPLAELARIAQGMGIEGIDLPSVLSDLNRLNYDAPGARNGVYHRENLLHQGHITDGRVGSWINSIDAAVERAIVERHRTWFEANGYAVEPAKPAL